MNHEEASLNVEVCDTEWTLIDRTVTVTIDMPAMRLSYNIVMITVIYLVTITIQCLYRWALQPFEYSAAVMIVVASVCMYLQLASICSLRTAVFYYPSGRGSVLPQTLSGRPRTTISDDGARIDHVSFRSVAFIAAWLLFKAREPSNKLRRGKKEVLF